jgi:hypothetical protein
VIEARQERLFGDIQLRLIANSDGAAPAVATAVESPAP